MKTLLITSLQNFYLNPVFSEIMEYCPYLELKGNLLKKQREKGRVDASLISWKWLNLQWAFDNDCGACCWGSHPSIPEAWRVSSIVNQTCFAEATPAPFGVWLVKKTSPKDFSQPYLLCLQTYRFLKNVLKITGFFQWLYDLWHSLFHGPTLFVGISKPNTLYPWTKENFGHEFHRILFVQLAAANIFDSYIIFIHL